MLEREDDLEAPRCGVAALQRSKIQRLTRDAQAQAALLTQEDLVYLFCNSRSSITRNSAALSILLASESAKPVLVMRTFTHHEHEARW